MSDPAKLRRMIFWQCRKLGIDNTQRHEIQATVCGFESMKDATKEALVEMVKHLAKRGANSTAKPTRVKSRRPVKGKTKIDRMITVAQRETIARWMGWKNLSAAYVRGLSRRMCGRDFPQTTRQASALIAALASDRVPVQNQKEQTLCPL